MKVKLPKLVIKTLETIEKAGFEVYIVGGAIRDILTGKTVTDWDFTTKAQPDQILKLFPEAFYDNVYGTVGIAEKDLREQFHLKKDDQSKGIHEITTFRREQDYSDHRRPDKVIWGKSLDEDLERRDFTINAMALKITNKLKDTNKTKYQTVEAEIIDPFNGQKDLKNKLIRAVGKADKRFQEDALRMMRAIRIASQLGFIIESNTLAAIKKNAPSIREIANERIRDELIKTIASAYPKDGMMLLFNSDLLKLIIPELLEMRGVQQSGHHTKDVWDHSLDSLAACPSPDPIVRLATLLHDVGKPNVKMDRGKGKEITFYNHEVVGARIAKNIARRLKMAKKDVDLLWLLIRWHMFAYDPKMTDKAIRRMVRRVSRDNINKMMMLRIGDRIGGGSKATSWRLRELQQRIGEVLYTPMEIKDMKVNGNDVMEILKIKGGPKVGKVLEKLFEEVMDDAKKNDRKYLLKRIENISTPVAP